MSMAMMLALTACQTTSNNAGLNNTHWILTDWSRHVLPSDKPVTIAITLADIPTNKNNKMYGQSFCNTFNATFVPTTNNKIQLGPVMSTKMACSSDKMDIENDYLGQISLVNEIEVISGSLVLRTSTGNTLIFAPA